MNEMQFYLAIAVAPVTTIIVVLIGVLLSNQHLNNRLNDFKDLMKSETSRLEARMDKMANSLLIQIAGVDARVGRVEERVSHIEERVSRIEEKLNFR